MTKSAQKWVESGGNDLKHVSNHFPQLSTHFWALFVILWENPIFEGHFWGPLEDFPLGTPLRPYGRPPSHTR